MFHIAACDNDRGDLEALLGQVQHYFAGHPDITAELHSFSGGEELAEQLRRGAHYDLLLLDILMPGIGGIELGRLARAGGEVPIIYLTSSREYALDAFENHALRYLLKPVDERELASALTLALSLPQAEQTRWYSVKTRGGLVSLAGDHIAVVEERARTAVYSLTNGSAVTSVSIRGTFDRAVAPLPDDPDFLHPHKSFFVNMRCICALHTDAIIMDDGRRVPIRRGNYPAVSRAYLKYLARESVKTV